MCNEINIKSVSCLLRSKKRYICKKNIIKKHKLDSSALVGFYQKAHSGKDLARGPYVAHPVLK